MESVLVEAVDMVVTILPISGDHMMRLIVYLNGSGDSFINISADYVEREDTFIVAYKGGQIVGMFDVCAVMALYLSEKSPNEKK